MTPTFIGYDQAERMVSALIGGVAEWRPDCVAGIARGGLVPATMVACALALPLSVISFERRSRAVAWVGAAPPPGRVVLVDDCCATGETLGAVRNALVAEGFPCLTLTIVHDPETTAFVPDFSHPMRTLFRLPWERGESTPAARALRATGAPADRRTELPFIGLALDGVFLPDRSRAEYAADIAEALRRRDALQPFARLPAFPPDRAVIITGRSEISRPQTEAWLR
ncbi:MAG TPA: phosphoribosyltransferase, partial [Acetobacteraceae bacterium]|nr:phosphoribosyltransferase [Acetobacteraceae bacterium]